ncbi:hypothetical protein [Amycolatopsis sp. WGS_07]|uniref:hypothetical protein n=1 Tax=Amycolatopsis sp. WGS_07 TaxID=3076764 RepID=UPI0038735165
MENDETLRPDDVLAVLFPTERRDLDEALRQHAAALARLQRLGALGSSPRVTALEPTSSAGNAWR